jgi:hypothetical protein
VWVKRAPRNSPNGESLVEIRKLLDVQGWRGVHAASDGALCASPASARKPAGSRRAAVRRSRTLSMAENKTRPTDASVGTTSPGKHRMGEVCLYFNRLADLDKSTLEKLVVGSIAEGRRLDWTSDPDDSPESSSAIPLNPERMVGCTITLT